MQPLFQVTPDELKSYLNPLDEPGLFRFGPNLPLTANAVQATINDQDLYVQARMPELIRHRLTHCDGAFLLGGRNTPMGALGNETQFILPLDATGPIFLFKNYPINNRPWASRTVADMMPAHFASYDAISKTLTLQTPLLPGETLIAEYRHTSAHTFSVLRRIVLHLAASIYARKLPWTESTQAGEGSDQWSRDAHADLKRLSDPTNGRLSIPELDSIDWVTMPRGRTNQSQTRGGPDW